MTLPRPALIGIAGLVAIVAAFLVMRGLATGAAEEPLTPSPPAAAATAPADAGRDDRPEGLPTALARALRAREVVVLLLAEPGAADDRATGASVRALRRRAPRGVAVFSDSIAHVARYRPLLSGLDVTQTPSIVIVGSDRRARLLEGFVDEGTLRQTVVDVLGR